MVNKCVINMHFVILFVIVLTLKSSFILFYFLENVYTEHYWEKSQRGVSS